MVREKGKISVISGIRAESEKAEAPGWFLQKDGSYLSAKAGGEVGHWAALSACPPGSLPCGETLGSGGVNVLIFLGCRACRARQGLGKGRWRGWRGWGSGPPSLSVSRMPHLSLEAGGVRIIRLCSPTPHHLYW